MRTDPCVLGIDLGTSSTKAILLDATGAELSVASAPVQLSRLRPGWVESDPEDWWLSVKIAVRKVLAAAQVAQVEVGAVGLSGQMHGVVLARSDGSPLRPAMLWLDRRAESSLEAYRALPAAYPRCVGQPPHSGDGRTLAALAGLQRAGSPEGRCLGFAAKGLAEASAGWTRWQRTE